MCPSFRTPCGAPLPNPPCSPRATAPAASWSFPRCRPPRRCADRHETVAVDAVGEVYSFTVIHPSAKSGEAPYALGYVDFPGPVRIFGRLQRQAAARHRRALCRAVPDERFGYVFEAVEH